MMPEIITPASTLSINFPAAGTRRIPAAGHLNRAALPSPDAGFASYLTLQRGGEIAIDVGPV